MAIQLHRVCAGDHEHELVQGDATALSAMYSPHLAMLIAQVIIPEAVGGGDRRSVVPSPSHQRVGAPEESQTAPVTAARSAPGQPGTNWWQPLKGDLPEYLLLKGPLSAELKEGVQGACETYLDFVKQHPYDREAFKRASELGLQVLQLAGGWEEAARSLRRVWVAHEGDHFRDLHGDFLAIVPWSNGGGDGLRIPSRPTFGTPAKQQRVSQQR